MDSYFPKTRRPIANLSGSLKRPPPSAPATPAAAPSTPKDARLTRPAQPPPVKRKLTLSEFKKSTISSGTSRELFKEKETHLHDKSKIASGPLRGISTTLLDYIRAKEAAAKATSPEEVRRQELLGIAPEIVRIVPTVFTANKKEVMLYDKVVEKCFKGLKSNYTTSTIIECLDLMDKVAPEWVTTVQISRGRFMRINRDKYTIPKLLEAIKRYKKEIVNQN